MSDVAAPVPADRVAAVRRFNRFHTRLVGALNEGLLNSDFSLAQARILYEVHNARSGEAVSAAALARDLSMDPGYISRLIAGLEKQGLLERAPAPDNARRLILSLTSKGRAAADGLEAASAAEVSGLLQKLSDGEQHRLVGAMQRVLCLLEAQDDSATFVLRDPEPGDLGWVVHRQAALYAREYGFDWTFEAMIAEIVAQFARDFDPQRERCWIADRDGQIVGSVFVVRQDAATAKLRMLYVEPSARGLGLGRRLVDECIRFAGARGYRRMVLWTNDVLHAARRIYQATGFELEEEEPHRSFGRDLVGQIWSRAL